jgi:FKBP-type peptidyl-prolyl isomerase-like protein
LRDIAEILARRGQPLRRRLRSGLMLLVDIPGAGEPIRRQHAYKIRLRLWLNKGEPVRWRYPSAPVGIGRLDDEGATLTTDLRIDRRSLVNGLFYGVEGMRIGGTRRLEIAPHLAYGERGIPGIIPPNALLVAEISVLDAVRGPGEPATASSPPQGERT